MSARIFGGIPLALLLRVSTHVNDTAFCREFNYFQMLSLVNMFSCSFQLSKKLK